jgi:hypothetical protein
MASRSPSSSTTTVVPTTTDWRTCAFCARTATRRLRPIVGEISVRRDEPPYPNGRGEGPKHPSVWVRIPPGAHQTGVNAPNSNRSSAHRRAVRHSDPLLEMRHSVCVLWRAPDRNIWDRRPMRSNASRPPVPLLAGWLCRGLRQSRVLVQRERRPINIGSRLDPERAHLAVGSEMVGSVGFAHGDSPQAAWQVALGE